MARFVNYPSFIRGAVMKYFRKTYGAAAAETMWAQTLDLYTQFVREAPDLGGSENHMSKNLYMGLALFAFYEATGRKISPEEIEGLMCACMPRTIPIVSALMDFNKPRNQERLRIRYEKYKTLSDEKRSRGEWGNNWRVELNPHGRTRGVAFDLVGCPIEEFAQKHGYQEIMPVLCRFDYLTASLIHAKLIREHTVAEGSTYCDYWYIGDREPDESQNSVTGNTAEGAGMR